MLLCSLSDFQNFRGIKPQRPPATLAKACMQARSKCTNTTRFQKKSLFPKRMPLLEPLLCVMACQKLCISTLLYKSSLCCLPVLGVLQTHNNLFIITIYNIVCIFAILCMHQPYWLESFSRSCSCKLRTHRLSSPSWGIKVTLSPWTDHFLCKVHGRITWEKVNLQCEKNEDAWNTDGLLRCRVSVLKAGKSTYTATNMDHYPEIQQCDSRHMICFFLHMPTRMLIRCKRVCKNFS